MSMIHDLDLLMCLWAKTCIITIYILDCCPYKALKNETSTHALVGEKHWVAHLCGFRFHIYIHFLDEKRTKLAASSLECLRPPKHAKSIFHLSGR